MNREEHLRRAVIGYGEAIIALMDAIGPRVTTDDQIKAMAAARTAVRGAKVDIDAAIAS